MLDLIGETAQGAAMKKSSDRFDLPAAFPLHKKRPHFPKKKARRLCCGLFAATAVVLSLFAAQTSVKSVDGVTVVKNGKRPAARAGSEAKLSLEPIWTVGGGDSPEQDFSRISAVAAHDDGSVFILDGKENRIFAFDAKGRFLRSFGKKGQGPGELNGPIGLMITPAGELLVEDSLNRRLSYFSLNGKFLRQQSMGLGLGLSGIMMDRNGRIVARSMTFEGGKIGFEIKTYDKDLKPGKTLAKVEVADLGKLKMDPLSRAAEIIFAPDGRGRIFMGSSKGYLIRVIDFDGRLLRTIEREFDPVPVSKEDRDKFLKLFGGTAAGAGVNLKDRIVLPDVYPPYSDFIVNRDGRLLVQTYEKGTRAKERFYDVFDAEGRYLARTPAVANFMVWRDDRLYGVVENEDGFMILKCFRVII
jgi:hypothetical protein